MTIKEVIDLFNSVYGSTYTLYTLSCYISGCLGKAGLSYEGPLIKDVILVNGKDMSSVQVYEYHISVYPSEQAAKIYIHF